MRNIDWLCENDRERLLHMLSDETYACAWCAENNMSCDLDCAEGRRKWLEDEHNDGLQPKNGVSAEDVDANDGKLDTDTREKLEADMNERLGELWADAWDAGSRDSMDDDFDIDVFNSLLDRQAAITEREIAERIRQLEAELNKWRKLTDGIELPDYPMAKFMPKDKDRRIAELEAELRECDEQRIEYRDQRDWYRDRLGEFRKKLGDAVWHAQAIARMTEVDA